MMPVVAVLAIAGWFVIGSAVSSPRTVDAAVRYACESLTTYDEVRTATTATEKVRVEISHSGGNAYSTFTLMDVDGTVRGRSQSIILDGARYGRESTAAAPDVYGQWTLLGTGVRPAPPLPCQEPAQYFGGSTAAHFVATKPISLTEGAVRNEFWVDSRGRPTRGLMKFVDSNNVVTGTMDIVYSGYGETNVIRAPIATPTPTPTPTATVSGPVSGMPIVVD